MQKISVAQQEIYQSHATYESNIERLYTLSQDYGNQAYTKTLNEIRAILSQEMQTLDKTIRHHQGIKAILTHLQDNLTATEISLSHHSQLMKVLNPKDGLIAKSVTGFIRRYVSEMNTFINQVWSYQFYIDTQDESVQFTKDYKFPVVIGDDHSGYSPDVFDTSTGQSEIIDVAYRFVMMKYAKFHGYPLYADELGSNLNGEHRDKLYSLLKRMHDEGRLSQLFIITHLNDIESQMGQAQVINLA